MSSVYTVRMCLQELEGEGERLKTHNTELESEVADYREHVQTTSDQVSS